MNKQKEWVQKLQSSSLSYLSGANIYFDQSKKVWTYGKREELTKKAIYDHITVSSNEIIYDFDLKSYAANSLIAQKIVNVLNNRGWEFNAYSTSKYGLHIEIFFNKPAKMNKTTKKLFKEAMSYNLSFKHIRFWLWDLIIEEAGISKEVKDKAIDSKPINFDDLQDKNRLIRLCGGRKIKIERKTGEENTYYKSFLLESKIPKKSEYVTRFEDVKYPYEVKTFDINEYEFSDFLQKHIETAKKLNITKDFKIDLKDEGGYLSLESVKKIREGLGRGQRSTGAQILAIAMSNDNIPIEEQKAVMEEYVGKCSQIGEPFTVNEATQWVEWVQSQPNIFWNCGLAEDAGLHEASMCDFCKKKNKEAYKFLRNKSLLKKINDVLDMHIVGERDTKMLMFLLMLSKDFPSKTGSPEWNVIGDPMSQNVIISSDSSSGKTYITKKLLKLFGTKDKDYFIVSRMTKNAFNYLTDINMDGKIIFIEELQGLDENTSQLRVWMSEGELTLRTVEKVKNEEGIEVNISVTKSTTGQPVFITNQAEGVIEDQINNRSWVVDLDTSGLQTRNILDYQDNIYMGLGQKDEIEIRAIKDAIKQLKQYHFIIPYSNNMALNMPVSDIRSRRDYTKLMTLIMCSTYLHQKQRFIVINEAGEEFIICDFKDYEIAKKYSSDILGAVFNGLVTDQIDLLNFIKHSNWNNDSFSAGDIIRHLGKTQPHWNGQLKQLHKLGYIMKVSDGNGVMHTFELNKKKVSTVINLPTSDDLAKLTYKCFLKIKDFSISFSPLENTSTEKSLIGANIVEALKSVYSKHISDITSFEGEIAPIKKRNKIDVGFCVLSENNNMQKQPLFIGATLGRIDIIKYFNKTNKHIVTIEDIITKFKEFDFDIIMKKLNELLKEGTLMKHKQGYIIL